MPKLKSFPFTKMRIIQTAKDLMPLWIFLIIIILLAFSLQFYVDYQVKECDNINDGCEYEKCKVKEHNSQVNRLELIDCLIDKEEIEI